MADKAEFAALLSFALSDHYVGEDLTESEDFIPAPSANTGHPAPKDSQHESIVLE